MEITIKGEPDEIAKLVSLATKSESPSKKSIAEHVNAIAKNAIPASILLEIVTELGKETPSPEQDSVTITNEHTKSVDEKSYSDDFNKVLDILKNSTTQDDLMLKLYQWQTSRES